MSRIEVATRLLGRFRAGVYRYVHFAIPCASWSAIQRMNGGTRRAGRPQGAGVRLNEERANGLAEWVAVACRGLVAVGGFFSIENPKGSYLCEFSPIDALRALDGVVDVVFDQCMYGLGKDTDGAGPCRVKKGTRILTNRGSLAELALKCDHSHEHMCCLGHVKVSGCTRSLPKLAGQYPIALTKKWASLVRTSLVSRPRRGPGALV